MTSTSPLFSADVLLFDFAFAGPVWDGENLRSGAYVYDGEDAVIGFAERTGTDLTVSDQSSGLVAWHVEHSRRGVFRDDTWTSQVAGYADGRIVRSHQLFVGDTMVAVER